MRTTDPLSLLKNHGGNPDSLAQALGLAKTELLDLSNAVSPFAYPLDEFPLQRLAQLPYESALLGDVAGAYYGVKPSQLVAGAGSQQFIQCLPMLRQHSTVLLPRLAYGEHAHHWQAQGHRCEYYDNAHGTAHDETLSVAIDKYRPDVLVLIHPNNPTGERVSQQEVLGWHAKLPAGGQMIIDEAFVDVQPEDSMASLFPLPGLIILRSAGKFFGLPGLRLGFLLADELAVARVASAIGPWPLSSLAQWAGETMLADERWHKHARKRLIERAYCQNTRLQALLPAFVESASFATFFTSIQMPHGRAEWLCRELLEQRIVVRYYHQHSDYACVRIGLTASNRDLERLQNALTHLANVQEGLSSRAI